MAKVSFASWYEYLTSHPCAHCLLSICCPCSLLIVLAVLAVPSPCSQDDFREYRCWQVLLDGQHWVTQFGLAIRQGGEAGAQQQDFVYQQTTNALYPLVTCEGRWMLDINAK